MDTDDFFTVRIPGMTYKGNIVSMKVLALATSTGSSTTQESVG